MDDAAIIAEIRLRVEVGDFDIDREHCDVHMYTEGFDLDQVIRVVIAGDVIEQDAQRNRWLFCGTVRGIQQDVWFRGRWLHISVERDEVTGVAIVPMYRPLVRLWRTARDRW